jgi:TolB-like protein
MIESCDRPIMFELTQTADLSHWRGDDNDRAWRTYVADVRRFIEAGPRATAQPVATPAARPSRRFGILATALSALLIVAAIVFWTVTRTGGEPTLRPTTEAAPSANATTGPVTLAVLPFADLSPEGDQEYFSDGLSEELLNVLAQIRELRVAGRTSSFAFKGRNEDLRSIAEQLGVANLLEGSVRKSGNRLRITAQLISAADGYHLWSQTYDRELDDVFAVQEEIAMAVADALSIALGVGDVLRVGGTRDVTAYDIYLQGRAAGNESTAAGIQRSRDLLTQATARDPQFAAAWIALGNANLGMATYSPERAGTALLESSAAFSRAIGLLPEGGDRQIMEAFARWVVDGDLAGAGRSLARGQAVPFDVPPEFREALGLYLMTVGRAREAVDMLNAVVTADPLKTNASAWLQFALDYASRSDAAEAEYARLTARLPPSVPMEFQKLERLWLAGAAPRELREQYERFVALDAGFMPVNVALGPVLDNPAEARTLIAAAIEDPFYQSFTRMGGLAQLAALFGDHDLALDALRRAHIGTRSTVVAQIWHPVFAPMRADPRFKAIVRDAGIYDAWRASGAWGDFCQPLGEDDFECR